MSNNVNDIFSDEKLVIYIDDNKFNLPLRNARGNVANILNFIVFALTNSGMSWQDVYYEMAQYIHYHIDNNDDHKKGELEIKSEY